MNRLVKWTELCVVEKFVALLCASLETCEECEQWELINWQDGQKNKHTATISATIRRLKQNLSCRDRKQFDPTEAKTPDTSFKHSSDKTGQCSEQTGAS